MSDRPVFRLTREEAELLKFVRSIKAGDVKPSDMNPEWMAVQTLQILIRRIFPDIK